jgi:hypothetical protein
MNINPLLCLLLFSFLAVVHLAVCTTQTARRLALVYSILILFLSYRLVLMFDPTIAGFQFLFSVPLIADFSLFYPITAPVVYTDNTTTEGFNIVGYHPYVRLKIINEGTYPVIPIGPPGNQVPALQGDITRILAR